MKKEQLKSEAKSVRKKIRESLKQDLTGKLQAVVAAHGKTSEKLNKVIEKEAKQLAKKIAKRIKISQPSPVIDQGSKEATAAKREPEVPAEVVKKEPKITKVAHSRRPGKKTDQPKAVLNEKPIDKS